MRVALVTTNRIPYLGANGSCVHLWTLTQALLQGRHEVALCCYKHGAPGGEASQDVQERGIAQLRAQGVAVHLIPYKPRTRRGMLRAKVGVLKKLVAPGVADFYDDLAYQTEVTAFVQAWKPDVVMTYGVGAVAATAALPPSVLRVASVVDLDHLAGRHKRAARGGGLRARFKHFAGRAHPGVIVRLLGGCDLVVNHAAHHYAWLRVQGLADVRYCPVLVQDKGGAAWQALRQAARQTAPHPRVLLVGKVNGAATLPGLWLMAEAVLPALAREMAGRPYEVHVVGGGTPPQRLRAALERPEVHLRGYVEDVAHEFLACDVLCVPTPVELGFRTRIAEGFSYGCCVVAHAANAEGMQELADGDNALLGHSGAELARLLARCLTDAAERTRLGEAARATFEAKLDGLKVGGHLVEEVEAMVRQRAVLPPPGAAALKTAYTRAG